MNNLTETLTRIGVGRIVRSFNIMSSNLTHEEIEGTDAKKKTLATPLPDWDNVPWRQLKKGEIIKEGDYVDGAANGWKDDAKWKLVEHTIGHPASCPQCPAHSLYRRLVTNADKHENTGSKSTSEAASGGADCSTLKIL